MSKITLSQIESLEIKKKKKKIDRSFPSRNSDKSVKMRKTINVDKTKIIST